MSGKNVAPLSKDDLDWVQLRQELENIRGLEKKKSIFSKETWFLPAGAFLTTVFFFYGFYHMNHPTKSIIGAYLRIFSQAATGIGCVYVFLKFSSQETPKKVNLDYHD